MIQVSRESCHWLLNRLYRVRSWRSSALSGKAAIISDDMLQVHDLHSEGGSAPALQMRPPWSGHFVIKKSSMIIEFRLLRG